MSRKAQELLRIALSALIAAGLAGLCVGGVSRAQTGTYFTYSSGPASFAYPADWVSVTPPQGDLVAYDSPDNAVEVDFDTGTPDYPTAVQELQSILDGHAADPSSFPNFRVIKPPANVQVPGASDAATDEYVYSYTSGPQAGTLQHFFSRVAFQNGSFYWLVVVVTDSQLAQYQNEVNQVLNSFQLSS